MSTQTTVPTSLQDRAYVGLASRLRIAAPPALQWRLLRVALVLIDTGALAAAFGLAYVIRFRAGIPFLEPLPERFVFYSSVAFWAVPVWLAIFAFYHLYDRNYLFVGFQEYTRVINACTAGVMAVIVMSFLDVGLVISRGWLLMVWALSMLLVGSSRFSFRRLVRWLRKRGFLITPTVIVGANGEGKALAEQFMSDPGAGTHVVGFVDNRVPPGVPVVGKLSVLGNLAELERVAREGGISDVVVATTGLNREELLELYRRMGHVDGVEVRLSSGLFEILTTGVRVQEISCVPLMTPSRVRITGIDAFMKSVLDYSGAILGLAVLSPLLVLIALLVKLDSPGPVLHRRTVLGRGAKPFDAFKFRTMVANADEVLTANAALREAFEAGHKLKADPRVTRVGGLLRRDEPGGAEDDHPRGAVPLREVAAQPADRQAGHHRSLAGPWQGRHPVRGAGPAQHALHPQLQHLAGPGDPSSHAARGAAGRRGVLRVATRPFSGADL